MQKYKSPKLDMENLSLGDFLGDLPVDGVYSPGNEKIIGLGKGSRTQETTASRQGARMDGFNNLMLGISDVDFFGLGVASPEDKDHGLFAFV